MAFAVDLVPGYRRGADCVDRILRGASPADLPVEGQRQFDFIVNVNAAMPLNTAARAILWTSS
jgi:putative ABC transport system substrate-binding protein